jgi:hypothetical protein
VIAGLRLIACMAGSILRTLCTTEITLNRQSLSSAQAVHIPECDALEILYDPKDVGDQCRGVQSLNGEHGSRPCSIKVDAIRMHRVDTFGMLDFCHRNALLSIGLLSPPSMTYRAISDIRHTQTG